jgi:DNA-binding SARP family transcriptional activator
LRLQILGPLRLWRGETELDPGPHQQALLLTVLLARADHPISRIELIDLIWGEGAPASATNVIHKYVGALRRLLEPDLPARRTGAYVQRRGDGYLFDSRDSGLDLIEFREHAKSAQMAVVRHEPQRALDGFVEALALWRGPAGGGLGGIRTAPLFVALNGEFFETCVKATDLAVRLGQPARVLPALYVAASMAPLDENVHAALATGLGAAGNRSEALETLRAIRLRLADELGVDPGPALRAAHQRVLSETLATAISAAGDSRSVGASDEAATDFIGRADELDVLTNTLRSTLAGARGVVVVDGEPGVGKTRLLQEMTAQAERWGALVAWGMCLEGDGTPSMWPWVKIVGAMLASLSTEERAQWLAGDLSRVVEPAKDHGVAFAPPDGGARFRLFEQAVALLSRLVARQPVVLVVDDLQWADKASLDGFSHMATHLPNGAVLVGALRDRAPAPGTELSKCLASVSRASGHHRIHLGPLGPAEVAELVRMETGKELDFGAVRSIHARTAGNPFFVRELSRLLAATGTVTTVSAGGSEVPSNVRDIVRSRTADLSDDVRWLLQIAALVGRDVNVTLLAHAAAIDVPTCLARVEPLAALGILEPAPGDPYSLRFPHDLVREALAGFLTPKQATELHLRIADAMGSDIAAEDSAAERLAYHLWAAGPLAEPSRTAKALVHAGRLAATKSAFEASEGQLQSAVQVARAAGLADLELSALAQLATVFWRQSGFGGPYTNLTRAEELARSLGQEDKAADFLFMRVVAAFSQRQPEADLLVRKLIEEGERSTDPTMRVYARHVAGMDQFEHGDVIAALRLMDDDHWTALDDARWRQENPLRRDLRMSAPLFRAVLIAVHGEVEAARALLQTVEDAVCDDPYAISVWARWAASAAQWAGDPAWGMRITERWRTVDPHHSFVNVDLYLRVSRCWARALTGDDPAGAAADAEQVILTTMPDSPAYGVTMNFALLAEMLLAAGKPNEAKAALDRADHFFHVQDERYAEPLRLLLHAKVLHACGAPSDAVHAAAARAETVSNERGAYVISRRAVEFMNSVE